MEFISSTTGSLGVTDSGLSELLMQVYVAGGLTTQVLAASLFESASVRVQGVLICAREKRHSKLTGIIIVVPTDSSARRLGKCYEAEIHLLRNAVATHIKHQAA